MRVVWMGCELLSSGKEQISRLSWNALQLIRIRRPIATSPRGQRKSRAIVGRDVHVVILRA